MPGWYIHMEAAKKMVDELNAGRVGAEFPMPKDPTSKFTTSDLWAKELGRIGYTWRNYLALGALGPDLFYLFPDYHGGVGSLMTLLLDWVREVYEPLDDEFLSSWNKNAQPVQDAAMNVANQVSGDVIDPIVQGLNSYAQALTTAVLDLMVQMWDWFGLFTSGVPQGFADNAFFWSDMLHYRKTYEFAQRLWTNATTEQQMAFALGWMTHCATDVTGHAFTNAKCGGPYRTHWQRHHLVENHMDAHAYDSQHGSTEPYGELDTSALHFRIAFVPGLHGVYIGRADQPVYDYFTGLPAYPTGPSAVDQQLRQEFFDVDSGEMPADVADLLVMTMRQVWDGGNARPGTGGPKVLLDVRPEFRTGDTGIPSARAIQDTFFTAYHYLKFTSSSGYNPHRPSRPEVFGDHRPPLPPNFQDVFDDPARGGDDHQFNVWDLLLALFAWPLYLAELGAWALTIPIAYANDLATFPVRESIYELFVVPAYSAYLASRKPLVMAGILAPKHDEIDRGLVELGVSSDRALADLRAALDSPDGKGKAPGGPDELSGRVDRSKAYGADARFPRDVVTDEKFTLSQLLHQPLGPSLIRQLIADGRWPSEFVRPWVYPLVNQAQIPVGLEPDPSHPGPWVQGDTARDLLTMGAGDPVARADLERATKPTETDAQCDAHLPRGEHLGNPVDYCLYVVGQLTTPADPDEPVLPDFNLDADRGYACHCWDWNRAVHSLIGRTEVTQPPVPPLIDARYRYNTVHQEFAGSIVTDPKDRFDFLMPCTPPQGFGHKDAAGNLVPGYDATKPLLLHYLDGRVDHDEGCLGDPVDPPRPKGSGPDC
jgi:hypothetical protein